MLEFLNSFTVPAPFAIGFIAAALFGILYLALSNFKNRVMLWKAKHAVSTLESRLKEQFERQLLKEEQFDTKIARLETRLEQSESITSEYKDEIDHLSLEVSSSIEITKQTAEIVLGGVKKELLRGVDSIEKLEAKLGVTQICEKHPSCTDETHSYTFTTLKTITQPTMEPKQFEEDEKKPELVSKQPITPEPDSSSDEYEIESGEFLSLVSSFSNA